MDPKKELLSPFKSENGKIIPRVKLTAEYTEFVKFCATPRELRDIKTQGDFAKQFGVSPDSLTDWRKNPGFNDAVRREIRSREQDGLVEVISGLRFEAEMGKPGAARLWLEYVGELKKKGQK
jgi:hypothetical protein